MTLFYGHQPRIVYDKELSLNNPFSINDPEISQAFYGELKNSSDYFRITNDKDFNLYLQILTPDFEGRNFSVEIWRMENGNLYKIKCLDGTKFRWGKFYEEYGGDNYRTGPEFNQRVPKGTYLIKVNSPDNRGKYSLAVGKKEIFDFGESMNALILIPKLKTQFWNKGVTKIYEGKIGKMLINSLFILLLFIGFLIWFYRKNNIR